MQVGGPNKKSLLHQLDLEGKHHQLKSNWATVDLEQTFAAVIEAEKAEFNEVCKQGFVRWFQQKEQRIYITPEWTDLCQINKMQIDPELQKRVSRKEMQMKAQKTHAREERWTNIDNQLMAICSSGCAIVGFFCRLQRGAGQEQL